MWPALPWLSCRASEPKTRSLPDDHIFGRVQFRLDLGRVAAGQHDLHGVRRGVRGHESGHLQRADAPDAAHLPDIRE